MKKIVLSIAFLVVLSGCQSVDTATYPSQQEGDFEQQLFAAMAGAQGEITPELLAVIEQYPLGSFENPVRAYMPRGQQEYLSRLRCRDGSRVSFRRTGNVGDGPYGSIVDVYQVACFVDNELEVTGIYMDMYHKDYVELRAVPNFLVVPPRPQVSDD
ncbi:hypothetical protein [Aliidiomarina indica]|uniref:hypothetical protein n=1 Tax=Aliidiomarina indica TaxID=2749147 RepID=UPI00188F65DF|nr:hypothetical protein [Aliidiomarina indica]